MFAGIIESIGRIAGVDLGSGAKRLRVGVGSMASECALGASVAIDGVCLTVVASRGVELAFDVVQETLDRSTLGTKRVGDRVNVERSLRIGDRLDGHFVQGHVDAVARVERVAAHSADHRVWFRVDSEAGRYLVPKGSVAVDGVSLTIAEVRDGAFSVALIPATLERTTLSLLRPGASVNVETDVLVRTLLHRLESAGAAGLTLSTLRERGFA